MTTLERLLSRVRIQGSCWQFNGSLNKDGYGRFQVSGRCELAHRVSYREHLGEIPEGQVVMHSCDNPSCINPEHLSTGTQRDNVEDMIAKGRKAPPSRTKARLSREQVLFIYNSDLTDSALAKQFGINRSVPWKIRRGHIWQDVTQAPATPE